MKILKESYPYYLVQDDTQISPYCVLLKTEHGFYQQLTKWYTYKGCAQREYTKLIRKATHAILDRREII